MKNETADGRKGYGFFEVSKRPEVETLEGSSVPRAERTSKAGEDGKKHILARLLLGIRQSYLLSAEKMVEKNSLHTTF